MISLALDCFPASVGILISNSENLNPLGARSEPNQTMGEKM